MNVRRLVARALTLLVLGAGLAACSDGGPGAGEARLHRVAGRVEVARPGGEWKQVRGGLLHSGDRIRVRGPSSRASLTLGGAGAGALELRRGTSLVVGSVPRLLSGDLLVLPLRAPITVDGTSARARVAARGAARLTRDLAFETGVYQGLADITSAGRAMRVPALRQGTVAAPGLISPRPVPLRYDSTDPWDRRFLQDAIELGRDLESRSRGLTGELPPDAGRTPGFFRLLLPVLETEPALTPALIDVDASPGEKVVGAAIAAEGRRGSFAQRWRSVFAFRAEGAEWGLVALDQQVRSGARLVSRLDEALARAAGLGRPGVASPGPAPTGGGTTTGSTGGGPPSSPPPSPPTTRPGPTTPTLPPTGPPPTVPPPDTGVDPVDRFVDPLVEAVNGVLENLLNPNPPPPPQLLG